MTRDDVVRLGQAGQPWNFLPVCWQVLRITPHDEQLRLLAAANLARLGLRTAALELLDTDSGEEAGRHAAELRAACQALPADRVGPEALAAMCALNLEAGAARGLDLGEAFDQWLASLDEHEWFRTLDGNMVRRPRAAAVGVWATFADAFGAAAGFASQHLVTAPGSRALPLASMYTVEGVNPPWILLQVAMHTARQKDGFWPRLMVVQRDPIEFLDGLACADARDVLAQERVSLFVGPEAAVHLGAALRGRAELQISGPCIPVLTMRTSAGVPEVLKQVQGEQFQEHQRLVREVEAIYAPRDRRWWRDRYRAALTPHETPAKHVDEHRPGDPLRVLVPTTRYSTYLQHSSADLVSALNAMGFEARLLIEPDDFSRMSSLAYLRMFQAFQPDLVILINHFKAGLKECIPPQVPFVCWVQDAMPHQFEAQAGAAQGALDFVAGHLHPEMFSRGGFERERAIGFPVVVSSSKFHDRPVDADMQRRYACEVALVSHHSETPERLHERMMREARDPGVAALLLRLFPCVMKLGAEPMGAAEGETQWQRLRAEVARMFTEQSGREAREDDITPIFRQYAMPMAERVLRHQTVQWAADIARRRGWRLALYGRGWEQVEGLAEFACGEATHGEELRAIYQCAAVQLHISATALVHQRVMECALSGGLPICRLTQVELDTISSAARRRALTALAPGATNLATRKLGLHISDDPGLMSLAALMQRLGATAGDALRDGFCWTNPPSPESILPENIMSMERRADWVFGDLAEVSFQSADELEQLIDRAVSRPAWRAGMSKWMAGRIQERLTHKAFMGHVLKLVQNTLES